MMGRFEKNALAKQFNKKYNKVPFTLEKTMEIQQIDHNSVHNFWPQKIEAEKDMPANTLSVWQIRL